MTSSSDDVHHRNCTGVKRDEFDPQLGRNNSEFMTIHDKQKGFTLGTSLFQFEHINWMTTVRQLSDVIYVLI